MTAVQSVKNEGSGGDIFAILFHSHSVLSPDPTGPTTESQWGGFCHRELLTWR